MADVDDRQPASPQPFDDREEPLGVALGERARRLVEDDHAGLRDQRPGDLDQLLRPDTQVADRWPRAGCRDARAARGPRPRSAGARGAGSSPPRTRSWPSMILASTDSCGRQRQLLVDHGHAARQRIARTARGVRLAVERHRARVGPNGAAEDLHQRALAGPVLADQGANLARARPRSRRPRAPASRRTTCSTPLISRRTLTPGRPLLYGRSITGASRPLRVPAASRRCSTRWGRRSRRPGRDTA